MQSKLIKATFFIGVFLVASCIYISTYWGDIGFDIFPFLDFNQLILYAIAPIIDKTLIYVSSVLIWVIFFYKIFPYAGYEKLKEKGELTKDDIILKIVIYVIIFILFPVTFIVAYFTDKKIFYESFPLLIVLFSVFLTNFLVYHHIVSPTYFDSTIVAVIVFILASSFSTGKVNSMEILQNQNFKYTTINSEYYKFLGKAGEHFIFISLDNQEERILNINKSDTLSLYNFDMQKQESKDSLLINDLEKLNKNAR